MKPTTTTLKPSVTHGPSMLLSSGESYTWYISSYLNPLDGRTTSPNQKSDQMRRTLNHVARHLVQRSHTRIAPMFPASVMECLAALTMYSGGRTNEITQSSVSGRRCVSSQGALGLSSIEQCARTMPFPSCHACHAVTTCRKVRWQSTAVLWTN